MKYIIRIKDYFGSIPQCDYVAEGTNYKVGGESYVPLTSRRDEARRYKSRKIAERASQRSGANMYGEIEIIEVDE